MATDGRGLELTSRVKTVKERISLMALDEERIEKLKEKIPETFEKTEAEIVPVRGRFILWTHDGKHVMWGNYGNRHFTGTDNFGKRAWGIFGKHFFAGFYDGEFFYGRYWRGRWRARSLFGLEKAHGRYVVFPRIIPIAVEAMEPQ